MRTRRLEKPKEIHSRLLVLPERDLGVKILAPEGYHVNWNSKSRKPNLLFDPNLELNTGLTVLIYTKINGDPPKLVSHSGIYLGLVENENDNYSIFLGNRDLRTSFAQKVEYFHRLKREGISKEDMDERLISSFRKSADRALNMDCKDIVAYRIETPLFFQL